ncbi:MAG: CPBP family intramembrane metalloprotease [Acidimicrobiaceae bacterium]|nr:CPBP family intramembrane metalloprotease [Acidimicrobiaceae bacterium]
MVAARAILVKVNQWEPTPHQDSLRGINALSVAVVGFLVGYLLATIYVLVELTLTNAPATATPSNSFGALIANLLGLWTGLLAAVIYASKKRGTGSLKLDFGLKGIMLQDLVIGIPVGVLGQLVIIPILYYPFEHFVPNLSQKLSQPAQTITGLGHGGGFLVLALFLAVGAPIVEELYFRGLLLGSLKHRFSRLPESASSFLAAIISSVLFGLAHGEPLQLLGLAFFGLILAALRLKFGRLGPGMFAHGAFNAVTLIALIKIH